VLEKDKLSGTNFLDWACILRIVANNAPRAERDAYSKHKDDSNDVNYLMLATMNSALQNSLTN
jgi:hypothetical protein